LVIDLISHIFNRQKSFDDGSQKADPAPDVGVSPGLPHLEPKGGRVWREWWWWSGGAGRRHTLLLVVIVIVIRSVE